MSKKGKTKADKKEVAKEDEPGYAENEEWVETLGKTLGVKYIYIGIVCYFPYYTHRPRVKIVHLDQALRYNTLYDAIVYINK